MIKLECSQENIQGLRDLDNRNLISLGNDLSAKCTTTVRAAEQEEGCPAHHASKLKTLRGRFLRGSHTRQRAHFSCPKVKMGCIS